ncbi:MAG: hypothetical protein JRN11_05925 [Nitrososphaerota archaeon]|nr:hypothetical protein [Nitrososphaerota archaeon]MDG7013187.1 hypothetical protein [Nitrososphaerota archaeon]MDG7026268.1 hypothetical protein [Nitrososphaerota archaeon]
MSVVEDSDDWRRFLAAMPNEATRKVYALSMKYFFAHCGLDNVAFVRLAKGDPEKAEGLVQGYVGHLRGRAEKGEIALSSVRARATPIKLFCVMNRCRLDWDFISRTIPKSRKWADDRAPTRDEIRRVLNLCTLRMKVAVEMMASGGFRVGAWDYMCVRDVEPVERDGRVAAAKVTVYRGEPEQYFTYVTPEAWGVCRQYLEYRRAHGEDVLPGAPLVRDEFAVSQGRKGTASVVKRLGSREIERELFRILGKSGLRQERRRRYEWKAAHGYRKWFKTQAEQVMRPIHVEMLMGHSTGVSSAYYRPTEAQLLEDYLKAVPVLSVTEYRDVKEAEEKIRAEFGRRVAQLEAQLAEVLRRQAAAAT